MGKHTKVTRSTSKNKTTNPKMLISSTIAPIPFFSLFEDINEPFCQPHYLESYLETFQYYAEHPFDGDPETSIVQQYLQKNFALAISTMYEFLRRRPFDPLAWQTMSEVAASIGQEALASRYADIAKTLRTPIPLNLPFSDTHPGYVLIKSLGQGLCYDYAHVLHCLLLCELTGRVPITHWGAACLYNSDPSKDAFPDFFEPLSTHGIQDLVAKNYDFWPSYWNDSNLTDDEYCQIFTFSSCQDPALRPGAKLVSAEKRNRFIIHTELIGRTERVLVCDSPGRHINLSGWKQLVQWIPPGHPLYGFSPHQVSHYLATKYLRPSKKIAVLVDLFAQENFNSDKMIAIHARGSDKYLEKLFNSCTTDVFNYMIDGYATSTRGSKIFLLTDDVSLLNLYRDRYGKRLVYTSCERSSTKLGVHTTVRGPEERKKIGEEIVMDMYLAAKCKFFVGDNSSMVAFVIGYALFDLEAARNRRVTLITS